MENRERKAKKISLALGKFSAKVISNSGLTYRPCRQIIKSNHELTYEKVFKGISLGILYRLSLHFPAKN